MNKDNFTIIRIDESNGHEDYWFTADKEVLDDLEFEYGEMCMIGITEIVYSKDEDVVGIKRQFPFNYDVVISDDEELKSILREIVE